MIDIVSLEDRNWESVALPRVDSLELDGLGLKEGSLSSVIERMAGSTALKELDLFRADMPYAALALASSFAMAPEHIRLAFRSSGIMMLGRGK